MTKQEIFDKVALHLLQQGRKSMIARPLPGTGTYCAYRGENGTRCAIGALIADEHYNPCSEGVSVGNTVIKSALNASGVSLFEDTGDYGEFNSPTLSFMRDLQDVHDHNDVTMWPDRLRVLASRAGLKPDVVVNYMAERS